MDLIQINEYYEPNYILKYGYSKYGNEWFLQYKLLK